MNMRKLQTGVALIEAMVAILIFSAGILAIVGLLAASTKSVGDAKYRLDASLLANQLVGQMLGSINRSTTAAQQLTVLNNSFSSPSGAAYLAWVNSVNSALPGSTAAPPLVVISATASTSPTNPSNQAVVTINWNAPNEPTGAHVYTTVAQIR
jgi:type IV pilus assembly protein PilV